MKQQVLLEYQHLTEALEVIAKVNNMVFQVSEGVCRNEDLGLRCCTDRAMCSRANTT